MKSLNQVFVVILLATFALTSGTHAADAQRRAEVVNRSADVMPFNLKDTTHVFIKTQSGGIQRVIAKNPADARQTALVREHLRAIQAQFVKGDFSGPTHIHGSAMPGLTELEAAKPGQIEIQYREVDAGAELTYRTEHKSLVAALHSWFDAQISDHGDDAMAGEEHRHHHGALMTQ
ncbi:aspartate carbamoyltransferase [Ralstonia sp. UBA689]|uniref:aspartate carbamoyltransferase n=1 Tax=Ralstonia sp. UBA689 TaxID=1947373 RepID=UPI0025EDC74F|nr:aspartate carbamoyltransferase [Ralstonia sp. UBA689]